MTRALVLLALVACRPKVIPTVDASPPAVDAAPPVIDAGPPPSPMFTLHSRFPGDADIAISPLRDGVAVVDSGASGWKLSTVGAGKAPRPLGKRVPVRSYLEDGFMDVTGTTELAFVRLTTGVTMRITAKGMARLPHRYADIVELRDGQWIGLETRAEILGQDWENPGKYELLGGTGSIPVIPSHLHPLGAVHLADGRICAVGLATSDGGVWTADVLGHQFIAPINTATIFRGEDGECYALDQTPDSNPPKRYSLVPVRGDEAGPAIPIDLKALGLDDHLPSSDGEGGMWFVGKAWVPQRLSVNKSVITKTPYPIPEKLEGTGECPHLTATHVVGIDRNDVWVLASCRDEQWHFDRKRPTFLLHTGPAGEIYEWPAL